MRYCPTCGRHYPDDYAYCTEDATSLVQASALPALESPTAAATLPPFWMPVQRPPLAALAVCTAGFLLLVASILLVRQRLAYPAAASRPAPPPAVAADKRVDSETTASFSRVSPSGNAISDLLVRRTLLMGEADDSRRRVKWPFRLRPTEFDPSTGRMAGVLQWPTLGSVHRVEGKLDGATLTFKETAFIHRGQAVLGPEYRLAENDEHNLTGEWQHVNHGTGGKVWCVKAGSGSYG